MQKHLTLAISLKQIVPEKLSLNSDWLIAMLIQEHAVLGEISSVASRKPFSFVYDQSDSDSEF